MNKYLQGINYKPLSLFPGIYFAERPGRPDSSYVISEYQTLQRLRRSEFFQFLAQLGQVEDPSVWDQHHIVEKDSLTYFFNAVDLKFKYDFEWPCVLIYSTDEHHMYNSLLRSKETKAIFGLSNPTSSKQEKQEMLQNVKSLYNGLYNHNHTLRTIANNILNQIII